ncbi:MAG: hypothetical protein KDA36_10940, partial [Planctomycetaceae bacterium]|nr:hypothetical protein [Planctomycetaceae bacterium]
SYFFPRLEDDSSGLDAGSLLKQFKLQIDPRRSPRRQTDAKRREINEAAPGMGGKKSTGE